MSRLLCLCYVVTVKSFPVLAFNVVIITIVFPDHTHLIFLMFYNKLYIKKSDIENLIFFYFYFMDYNDKYILEKYTKKIGVTTLIFFQKSQI